MIVFESTRVRHVVVRLDRGEDLLEALRALAVDRAIGAAWVAGVGVLQSCELTGYDAVSRAHRPTAKITEPLDIVNLTGNISFEGGAPSVQLHATLSRARDGENEVVAGRLVRGQAFACELRLDVYDDVALGREHDAATGLALWAGEGVPVGPRAEVRRPKTPTEPHSPTIPAPPSRPAAPDTAATSGGLSWAEVASASVELPKPASVPAATLLAQTIPAAEAVTPRLSLAERRRQAKIRQAAEKQAEARQGARFRASQPSLGGGGGASLPSRKRMTEEEFFDEVLPETGDFVDHKVFGLCRVEGETQSGGLVIRLENGTRKAIRLDYLDVSPPRIDDRARKVFALQPRRRG